MREVIRLQAHTSRGRIRSVQAVQRALSDNGGWVLDYQLFSNAAASINFEIPASGIRGMVDQIRSDGIVLGSEMEDPETGGGDPPDREIRGSIFVQFLHRDPDLKIKSPAVPG